MVPDKVSDDFTVFISYAHSDNESSEPSNRWLNRLLEYLRPLVIQSRISTWSDTEIEVGEQWDKSIKAQLQNANAAVLLISPAFLGSKYIRNSELPALLMNAMNKGVAVLPIILRHSLFAETTFKYPDPAQGPGELALSIFQAANPPGKPLNSMQEHEQDAVLLSVAQRILALARTKNTTGSPTAGSTVWTLPLTPTPFFTGRAQVLDSLRRELTAGGKAALSGMGGIGKTQTAAEYAYRHRGEYRAVLWAKADGEDSLKSDFSALAARLNLLVQDDTKRDKAVSAVKRWLEAQSGWLLILDNADDLGLVADLLQREWAGHILLTTRSHATGGIGRVELSVMSSEEGALFLLRRAKLIAVGDALGAATEADRELATEINREMGGLPLALDQAGAFIEEMSSSLAEYLELYRSEGDKLRAEQVGYSADQKPVTITFSLAFRKVVEANVAAADLLRVCAFLAPDAIPEEVFASGAREMGENLRSVAGGGINMVKVMGEAGRFSLIRRDRKGGSIEMHRVVQKVLMDEMSAEERRLWAERVVRGVNAAFPEVEHRSWPLCEKLLPHALEAARLIEKHDLAFAESARLLNEAGNYCFERAQYAEAVALFKRALAIRERMLGAEHPDVAMSLSDLAAVYDHQGRYAEAEPLFKRALAIHEQMLKSDNLNVALILNNLAGSYYYQGRYAEAEPLYERSLAIRERALGPDHPVVATSLNNLAALYKRQSRYAEAEPLFERSLAIREQALEPGHPDLAGSLNSLASLYNHQGRYAEAEPLFERSLAIRERALGPDHPDLTRSLNNLAALYESQGRYAEARPLLERSLAIYEKTFEPNHPEIAPIQRQYTELLKRSGDDAEK
ncbi:MAG TPA: FxSxx-COOH system tetratricopeptide repeat protein [Pyrinomonadaceae bacterium]